jgi:hypothetical protein
VFAGMTVIDTNEHGVMWVKLDTVVFNANIFNCVQYLLPAGSPVEDCLTYWRKL